MKTKLIISGLAFLAITTLASAQNQGQGQKHQKSTCTAITFMDENKNRICDNYEGRVSNATFGTGNGNSRYCGGTQQCNGKCVMTHGKAHNRNFVDSDKNGICDFRENHGKK